MDPEDVELVNPPNPTDGDAGETAKGYGAWALIVFMVGVVGSLAWAFSQMAKDRIAGFLSSASGGDGQLVIGDSGVPVEA